MYKRQPLGSGAIMETTVKAVKKGAKGDPGELKGDFSVQRDVGTVTVNSSDCCMAESIKLGCQVQHSKIVQFDCTVGLSGWVC